MDFTPGTCPAGHGLLLVISPARDRVETGASAGTATTDTLHPKPGSRKGTMQDQGIRHIFRTGGPKAASLSDIGRERQFVRSQGGTYRTLIQTGHDQPCGKKPNCINHVRKSSPTLRLFEPILVTFARGCGHYSCCSAAIASLVASRASRAEACRAG